MLWVDPTDPEVFAAVVGDPTIEPDDELQLVVNKAVAIASELLTLATAFLIHPAGQTIEESQARRLTRLNPLYGPLTEVVSLTRVLPDDTEQPVPYRRVGNAIQVGGQAGTPGGSVPLWRTNWGPRDVESVYRLTYHYASTVTPTARAMMLHYAQQFYFWLTAQDDDCQLPENVTSIDREGLGIELATPQDFLDKGRTGIAKIDTWLSQINAKRALRPSAVYTPDAPPGVPVGRRIL